MSCIFDFRANQILKFRTARHLFFALHFIFLLKMFATDKIFDNGVLNNIIYGSLSDESSFKSLIQHDYMKMRKDKFKYQQISMDYHFYMCHENGGFKTRYHISERAFTNLVRVLRCDITPNK